MDAPQFDRLSKTLAGTGARRGFILATAGLMAALPFLPDDADAVERRRGRGAGAEHFRHKKATYCLNGTTIRRYRRKQKKLLARGATLGKCSSCVPTTCDALGVICGTPTDGCGGTLRCGDCDLDLTCCSGQCVNLVDDDNNCGACGLVCDVANFFECSAGLCQTG